MSEYLSVAVADPSIRMQLEAMRSTISEADLDLFFSKLTLLTWGSYFPPQSDDNEEITSRVFAVMSGLVAVPATMPECPKCGKSTVFNDNKNVPFCWAVSYTHLTLPTKRIV